MQKKLFLVAMLTVTLFSQAQDLGVFQKHYYINGKDSLAYRLMLPKDYNAKKTYPLVFFLHGVGERGMDNEIQLVHGGKLFANDSNRTKFPAIVVFPQCPVTSFWANVDVKRDSTGNVFGFKKDGDASMGMKLLNELLHKTIKEFPVDNKRIYVGGLSMGGMGTFELVRRNPGLFAAAFPICGGGAPESVNELKSTNWWIFHGGKDNVVPPKYSEIMAKALKDAKADVRYTVYPEVNHNSWDNAFAEPALLPWVFSNKKK